MDDLSFKNSSFKIDSKIQLNFVCLYSSIKSVNEKPGVEVFLKDNLFQSNSLKYLLASGFLILIKIYCLFLDSFLGS